MEEDDDRLSFSSMTVRDEDLDTSGLWNESDLSVTCASSDESIATVVPDDPDDPDPVEAQATPAGTSNSTFKVPPAPPGQKCPHCSRVLKTKKGFENHVLIQHKWKKASQRTTGQEGVMKHLRSEGGEICNEIITKADNATVLGLGLQVKEKLNTKEWMDFRECASQVVKSVFKKKSKVIMPSVMHEKLLIGLTEFYAKTDFLNECYEKFNQLVTCEKEKF